MVLKWFCCGFTDRIWPKLLHLHLQGNKQAGHWFTCNLLTKPAMFQPKIRSKYQGIQPWQGDFHEGNIFSSENSFFHLIWSGSQTSAAHHWLSHFIVALLTILESAVYYRQHSSFVFLPCLCQRRCPVRVQLALHWRLLPLSSLVHCAILTAGASWPRFDSLPLPTRRHFAASSRVLCHNKG